MTANFILMDLNLSKTLFNAFGLIVGYKILMLIYLSQDIFKNRVKARLNTFLPSLLLYEHSALRIIQRICGNNVN